VLGYVLLRNFDVFAALREHGRAMGTLIDQHPVAAVAIYITGFVGLVVLSLPGAFAMTVAGGFLFGLVPGTALAVVSATLGAVAIFLAVRLGFGGAVRPWLMARGSGSLFARIERGLQEDATIYLLLLRLIPAVPFPVANIAPAFFGVRIQTFALTTFLGIMPGTALTAWIGHGLNGVLSQDERPDFVLLGEPEVFGPLAALIVLVALPLVVKRLRKH
jgi:uncharacterized membrane protein YdjX (TVP38/TMEM64 family)